jgi:hypothetical protein
MNKKEEIKYNLLKENFFSIFDIKLNDIKNNE